MKQAGFMGRGKGAETRKSHKDKTHEIQNTIPKDRKQKSPVN